VCEGRRRPAKRIVQRNMLPRRNQPLYSSNNMRDLHGMVVDDVRQMVCRCAVGLHEYDVVVYSCGAHLASLRLVVFPAAVCEVFKCNLAVCVLQSEHMFAALCCPVGGLLLTQMPTGSVVASSNAQGEVGFVLFTQRFGAAEAAVGVAVCKELGGGFAVYRRPLRLINC
jgi:hypothetical protein